MTGSALIVDDSPSARQVLSINLRALGFSVDEARDGIEGYSKAILGAYDVIITDSNMPNMSGLEFIRKFRAHPSSHGVSIIFVSARSDASSKREAKAAGAVGWFVKPFDRKQLCIEINRVADITCIGRGLGLEKMGGHQVNRKTLWGATMLQVAAPGIVESDATPSASR